MALQIRRCGLWIRINRSYELSIHINHSYELTISMFSKKNNFGILQKVLGVQEKMMVVGRKSHEWHQMSSDLDF